MRLIILFAIAWLGVAVFMIWDRIPKDPTETQCTAWLNDPMFTKLKEALYAGT